MSNKITGDENYFTKSVSGYEGHQGISIKQEALLRFANTLLGNKSFKDNHNNFIKIDRKALMEEATLLTDAYIEQLNK